MAVRLVVAKGTDEGGVFEVIEGRSMVIGRSPRADIVLHDEGVSRRHCRVRMENGVPYLADLNSKNGTSINGRRIAGEAILNDRETISVGFSLLEVRITEDTEEDYDAPSRRLAEAEAAERASQGSEASSSGSFAEIEVLETVEKPRAAEESGSSVMGAFEEFLELPAPEGAKAKASESAVPPPVAIETPPEAPSPRENDPLIGHVVAGYRIDAFLREEDVSRVYAAFQLSMERKVCMKALSPNLTNDVDAVHRFIQAARSAGKLSHPNIVQVFDAGEEDGVNFIAIELVDGTTLREYIRAQGRNRVPPVAEAMDLADQIGDAMAYAHANAVVHGGLTLDNIYVTPHRIAKLADLGFSKSLADSGIEQPGRFGERPGNPYFAAPEQLADPARASPAADVYSLGAVLFVMLTGHMPFRGNSVQEILERVRAGRRETVRRLRREVPVELGGFVDRAMALKPEDRPVDAARFLEDLRQLRGRLRL